MSRALAEDPQLAQVARIQSAKLAGGRSDIAMMAHNLTRMKKRWAKARAARGPGQRSSSDHSTKDRAAWVKQQQAALTRSRPTQPAATEQGEAWEIACHEAGHAVIGVVQGERVDRVTVVSIGEMVGHAVMSNNDISATMAGGIAQAKARGTKGEAYSPGDYQLVNAALWNRYPSQSAEHMAARFRLEADSRTKAKRLVDQHWPQIKAVARKLIADKTLTGQQVRQAMRTPG